MNKGGAPKGNQNAIKGRLWNNAINRALEIWDKESRFEGKKALDALAMQLLQKCADGDISALKELGDRLDGKPAQSVTVGEDPEKPFNQPQNERPKMTEAEWFKAHGIEKTG